MTPLTAVTNAYLEPLLRKHNAGQPLLWEDLEASRAASTAIVQGSDNKITLKRVDELHHSQIQAYREAAVKALREWCQTEVLLEPMEEADTENAFVERCVAAYTNGKILLPRWHLDVQTKNVVVIEIRKRARATFAKYHPQDAGSDEVNAGDGEDEGEVDEDGEVEDEDMQSPVGAAAKRKPQNNSAKRINKKKAIVRKKATVAKQAVGNPQRRSGPSNRGRRGGRGGGNPKSG